MQRLLDSSAQVSAVVIRCTTSHGEDVDVVIVGKHNMQCLQNPLDQARNSERGLKNARDGASS